MTPVPRDDRRARRREREARAGLAMEPGRSPVAQEAWEWGKTILLTLFFLVLIRSFLVQTFVITSGSMEGTLLVGDFLMVNRLALGTRLPGTLVTTPGYSEPVRGDVLVFDPRHEEGIKLVKRLIGMPGDTLEMRDKRLWVNRKLQDEPYVKWAEGSFNDDDPIMRWQLDYLVAGADKATYHPTRDSWGPLVVPEGYYFMLGDNRDFSYDSRYWGVIERWRLEGRAMFFYFSYDRDSPTPFSFLREIRWNRIGHGVH
ncbi:MAG: signal peptidase I [Gemmatimonadetes bacterium]|nr:signal peptidase I [Gemmatimonadota bacterium]